MKTIRKVLRSFYNDPSYLNPRPVCNIFRLHEEFWEEKEKNGDSLKAIALKEELVMAGSAYAAGNSWSVRVLNFPGTDKYVTNLIITKAVYDESSGVNPSGATTLTSQEDDKENPL